MKNGKKYIPRTYKHAIDAFELKIKFAKSSQEKKAFESKRELFSRTVKEEIIKGITKGISERDFDTIESFIYKAKLEEKRNEHKLAINRYCMTLKEIEFKLDAKLDKTEKDLKVTIEKFENLNDMRKKLEANKKRKSEIINEQKALTTGDVNRDPKKWTELQKEKKEIELYEKGIYTKLNTFLKAEEQLKPSTSVDKMLEIIKNSLKEMREKKKELENEEINLKEQIKKIASTIENYKNSREYGFKMYLKNYINDGIDLEKIGSEIYLNSELEMIKFSTLYYERETELLSISMQMQLLENIYGNEIKNGNPIYIYRACSIYDNLDDMIVAKDKEGDIQPTDHIANGSSSENFNSPYISTTKSPFIMPLYSYVSKAEDIEMSKQVAINVSLLYKALSQRKDEIFKDGRWKEKIAGEEDFLMNILADNELFDYAKIESKFDEIVDLPEHVTNSNLPTMIFNASTELYIDEEFEMFARQSEEKLAISPRSILDVKQKKSKDYALSSLEVLIKKCIPAYYIDSSTGTKQKIITELDPLTSDLIQCMRPEDSELNRENSLVELNSSRILEKHFDSLVLSPEHKKFAHMYYIEKKPLSEIALLLSKGVEETNNMRMCKLLKTVCDTKEQRDERDSALISFGEMMRTSIVNSILSNEGPFRDELQNMGYNMAEREIHSVISYNSTKSRYEYKDKSFFVGQVNVNRGKKYNDIKRVAINSTDDNCAAAKAAREFLEVVIGFDKKEKENIEK